MIKLSGGGLTNGNSSRNGGWVCYHKTDNSVIYLLKIFRRTKAFDPFSNRKTSKICKKAWREFNLPPTTQNHVAQREEAKAARERSKEMGKKIRSRRALPQWVQDDLKATAKMERQERNMGIEPNSAMIKEDEGELGDVSGRHHVPLPSVMPSSKRRHGKLEAQRPDECLTDFRARVRKAKLQSLKEEHRRTSSSAIKKKAFLREKKIRKKKFKTATGALNSRIHRFCHASTPS